MNNTFNNTTEHKILEQDEQHKQNTKFLNNNNTRNNTKEHKQNNTCNNTTEIGRTIK